MPKTAPNERQRATPLQNTSMPEEVAEAVRSCREIHNRQLLDSERYRHWGNITPRRAAKLKRKRQQLIGWLKMLTNTECRFVARYACEPVDTLWVWKELNIEMPR